MVDFKYYENTVGSRDQFCSFYIHKYKALRDRYYKGHFLDFGQELKELMAKYNININGGNFETKDKYGRRVWVNLEEIL